MKKYCSFHDTYHDVSEFGKNKNNPDGLQQYCRAARKEIEKKYYNKHYKTIKNSKKKKMPRELKDFVHYSNWLKASLDDGCLHWRRLRK